MVATVDSTSANIKDANVVSVEKARNIVSKKSNNGDYDINDFKNDMKGIGAEFLADLWNGGKK
jgi:hypothetical protein